MYTVPIPWRHGYVFVSETMDQGGPHTTLEKAEIDIGDYQFKDWRLGNGRR